jgi:hypothetical protein
LVQLGRQRLAAVQAAGDDPTPAGDLSQRQLVVDALAGRVAPPRLQVEAFLLRVRCLAVPINGQQLVVVA